MLKDLQPTYYRLLAEWVRAADPEFHTHPTEPKLGYYGTGFRHWGYQTVANFANGYTALANGPDDAIALSGRSRDELQERALAGLRFVLRTHSSGDLPGRDGTKWGTDWISGNLLLRAIEAIEGLRPLFEPEDEQRLRALIEAEAEYLINAKVVCNRWPEKKELGRTNAEANAWNGSVLLHSLIYLPNHPRTKVWREGACRYFINTLSVPQDEHDDRVVDGRPISEWFVGPNLHPNYAFEHHGFVHYGYMAISLEELLYTWAQCRRHGFTPPESLFHHWEPVWDAIKRGYVRPGRLGYLAGEDWPRYVYCQAYFLSMLPGLHQYFNDPDARLMEEETLETVLFEQAANADGHFCAKRMVRLQQSDPVSFYRVESDFPGFIARSLAYYATDEKKPLVEASTPAAFESNVSGHYYEPDARFIVHRSPTRLASFSWAASKYREVQGTISPPGGGHLLEWEDNLAGNFSLVGFGPRRRVVEHHIAPFEGGFLTTGTTHDHVATYYANHKQYGLKRKLCAVALPDGHSLLWLSRVTTLQDLEVVEQRGLSFQLANDVFNGHVRRLHTPDNVLWIEGLGTETDVVDTGSTWVWLEEGLVLAGLGGGDTIHVLTPSQRNAPFTSLLYDTVCYPYAKVSRRVVEGGCVEQAAALLVTQPERPTENPSAWGTPIPVTVHGSEDANGVTFGVAAWSVRGRDGKRYGVVFNGGDADVTADVALEPAGAQVLAGPAVSGTGHTRVSLAAGSAVVLQLR